jgi:Citrate synthase
MTNRLQSGLDDVVAAETMMSHVDGAEGRLILRGHDIEDLAGSMPYEAVVALVWRDVIDGGTDLAAEIGAGRVAAYRRFLPFVPLLAGMQPVEAMRLMISAISDDDDLARPAALVGAVGVAAAMAMRVAAGGALFAPEAKADHAADILRMARGRAADAAEAAALDAYLVTVLDHGLNASTFTGRIVASTRAGDVSTVIAALCALKGPLHGGAPGPVLDMLDAIGAAENATAWLAEALARGERLMGFGHRVYRTRDPRADTLKRALKGLKGRDNRLPLAEAVERAALELLARRTDGRRLDVNVEFYTALLLEALGLPREGFTPVFAAGRVAGWLAHAAEQTASGRLIRPQSRYVGPMPTRAA